MHNGQAVSPSVPSLKLISRFWFPLKSNPRSSHHCGGDVFRRQTVLWSTEAKVWGGIVPKTAWHWGGDISIANDPFGAPGSTPSFVCLPPTWGFASGDCLISLFLWDYKDHNKSTEKMTKAIKRIPVIQALQLTTSTWEVPYGNRNSLTHPSWVCR
jgi:hypothetical protein